MDLQMHDVHVFYSAPHQAELCLSSVWPRELFDGAARLSDADMGRYQNEGIAQLHLTDGAKVWTKTGKIEEACFFSKAKEIIWRGRFQPL
jgi:hypothetical protein